MSSPEAERRIEADLSAHLMHCPRIPIQAVFSTGRVASFLGISPTVVTNWSSRYVTFPAPINGDSPKLYDIRAVIRWWIHWTPEGKRKAGKLPEDWFDRL